MKNPYFPIKPERITDTKLSCPSVSYKYNLDGCKRIRKIILFVATSISIFMITGVCNTSDALQSCLSAFLGGLLGIFVWLLTTCYSDRMQAELSEIDACVGAIDKLLNYLQTSVNFIDPNEIKIYKGDENNLHYRNMHLMQLLDFLKNEPLIVDNGVMLKWFDGTEKTLDDYSISLFTDLQHGLYKQFPANKIMDVVLWNEHIRVVS